MATENKKPMAMEWDLEATINHWKTKHEVGNDWTQMEILNSF